MDNGISDRFVSLLNLKIHDRVVAYLEPEKRGRLLDVGAGDGTLALRLQDMGFDVTAADLIVDSFRPSTIVVDDLDLNKRTPYEAEAFEVVVATELIEHLENPWLFIREMHRITKPGGLVVLSTPNLANVYVRAWFTLTGRLYNFGTSSYRDIGHITPIFLWNLRRMVEKKFDVEFVSTNASPIPKTKACLPIDSLLFGQCIVVKLRRLPGPPDARAKVWTHSSIRRE